MIDNTIEFDYSNMPKSIIELIKQLEVYDKANNELMFNLKFDELDITAKGCMLAGYITELDFYTIEHKYGRLYD